MNFFHQRIVNPAGSPATWNDYVNKILKTAGEAKPECEDDPRGQCRGQVINNDNEQGAGQSYQDGESVKGKKDQAEGKSKDKGEKTAASEFCKKCYKSKCICEDKTEEKDAQAIAKTILAKCGKEMGESNDAGKVTEKHTDAGPGDDEHTEPKVRINDDPNYQKGESNNPGKVTGKNKKGPGDPVVGKGKSKKESSKKSVFEKISSLSRPKKIQLIAMLGANKNNPKAYIEAMVGIKLSNMTPEEKEFVKTYWTDLEGDTYAADMVEER